MHNVLVISGEKVNLPKEQSGKINFSCYGLHQKLEFIPEVILNLAGARTFHLYNETKDKFRWVNPPVRKVFALEERVFDFLSKDGFESPDYGNENNFSSYFTAVVIGDRVFSSTPEYEIITRLGATRAKRMISALRRNKIRIGRFEFWYSESEPYKLYPKAFIQTIPDWNMFVNKGFLFTKALARLIELEK